MATHIDPLLKDETGQKIANSLNNFLLALRGGCRSGSSGDNRGTGSNSTGRAC